jgi:hypothetical protein
MTRTVTVIIRETTSRHGTFEARTESGRALCVSSSPFIAAARVLLAQGYAPETRVQFRHHDCPYPAAWGPIGKIARIGARQEPREGGP